MINENNIKDIVYQKPICKWAISSGSNLVPNIPPFSESFIFGFLMKEMAFNEGINRVFCLIMQQL